MDNLLIDMNLCLPVSFAITGIDDILYDIGLSLDSNRAEAKKRTIIHKPLIITATAVWMTVTKALVVYLGDRSPLFVKMVGSPGNMFGIKIHVHLALMSLSIITLTSQSIYYFNHKTGVKQTFVRIFQVMSGSVPPVSIGMTDPVEITKLMKTSRVLLSVAKWSTDVSIPISAFIFVIVLFIDSCNIIETFNHGFYNALICTLWVHNLWRI